MKNFLLSGLFLALTAPALADEIKQGPAPTEPSKQQVSKINRTLVWCTNSVGRIVRGQMNDGQIKKAKEKYFSKRGNLDLIPNLMSYVPKSKKEMPPISMKEDVKLFEGKSYRQIVQFCDKEMMQAYNRVTKVKKASNIAEEQIQRAPFAKQREKMKAEQKVGQKMGLKGVTYGLSAAIDNILARKIPVEEYKKFLIKPNQFDNAWIISGSYPKFATAQMWNGMKSNFAVILKGSEKNYSSGSTLPKAYYKLKEVKKFRVKYGNGATNLEDILVFEHVRAL